MDIGSSGNAWGSMATSMSFSTDVQQPPRIGSSHGVIRGGKVVRSSSIQGHGIGRLAGTQAEPSTDASASARNYFGNVGGSKASIPNPPHTSSSSSLIASSHATEDAAVASSPSWSSEASKNRVTLSSRGGTRRVSSVAVEEATPSTSNSAVKRHSIALAQDRSQALVKKIDQIRTSGSQDALLSMSRNGSTVGNGLGASGFESKPVVAVAPGGVTVPTNPLARRASQARVASSQQLASRTDSKPNDEPSTREPVSSSGCCS